MANIRYLLESWWWKGYEQSTYVRYTVFTIEESHSVLIWVHSRVEWFSTFLDFWKRTHFCWSGLFSGTQFQKNQGWALRSFSSEHSVLFRSFKEHNVLFHSFFEFLATWDPIESSVIFHSFSKERKRTQRTQHSIAKNVKECNEPNILLQRT